MTRWSRRPFALIAIGLAVLPSAVLAQDSSGANREFTIHGTNIEVRLPVQHSADDLLPRCDIASPERLTNGDAFICAGYLTGAEDAMHVIWASNGLDPAFCKPRGTERRILVQAFVDFARAHPEKGDLPAALVMLQAYREKFPCKAGDKP